MIVFTKKIKKNSKKLLTVYIVFGIVPIVATISKTYNRNAICGRWDLNPHERNAHKILSLARLPVPTLPHIAFLL